MREADAYGLALQSASPQLGAAVGAIGGELRTQSWDLGWELATHLQLCLAQFLPPLAWGDLSWLAVAIGPGSFTGTRAGVATARVLAQQLALPLFGISTLAAVARSQPALLQPEGTIAVRMPARRNQQFGAIYRVTPDGQGLLPALADTAMTAADWQQTLAAQPADCQVVEAPPQLGATASGVWHLAARAWQQGERPHWSQAAPFYGQHPVG